jgi:hypothetical protein
MLSQVPLAQPLAWLELVREHLALRSRATPTSALRTRSRHELRHTPDPSLAPMSTPSTEAHAPRSRRAFVATAAGIGVVLACVLRALALPALAMDGSVLVDILARADGGFPLYYHALYLPLAALVEFVVGTGRSIDALLWLSAISGAAALFVASSAFEREFGARPALLAAAAALASPAFWFMSANIEVHATQLLGGSVALAAGVFAGRRSTASAAVVLFAAVLFATLVHNSNALLALGPALVAARRSDGRMLVARAVRLAVAAAAASALGLVLDHLARGGSEIPTDNVRLDRLVFSFAQAPSIDFYTTEFLYAWFPLLAFACVSVPRSRAAWRAALPFLAGAAPVWLVFLSSGILSAGGYFGSGGVFVLAAALAARRADGTSPFGVRVSAAAFAVVCAIGVGSGIADTRTSERIDLARIGGERLAIARIALPSGGLFVSLDPSLQYVSGRSAELVELPLAFGLQAVLKEKVSLEVALDVLAAEVERAAAQGRPLAFNMAWRSFAEQLPDVARFHELLLERCERHYRLEPRDVLGFPFLVGTPL